MKKSIILILAATAGTALAAEITVDASQGQTIQSALDQAKPGDTILVKPGIYPEQLVMKNSGEEGKPITLKSEVPRGAVLDGADPITGWKKVESAQALGGDNKNWAEIYYTEFPGAIEWSSANLYELEILASLAQDPRPADPFYSDAKSTWRKVPSEGGGFTSTSITDPEVFNQKDPAYWDGAVIYTNAANNNLFTMPITAFDPATSTVTFNDMRTAVDPAKTSYSVVNHTDFIRAPGDFAVKKNAEGPSTIYYWPRDAKGLEAGNLRVSTRKRAIDINQQEYIHIIDFKIRQYAGADKAGAIYTSPFQQVNGIHVCGCEILNCRSLDGNWVIFGGGFSGDSLIEGNYVHHNQFCRGIGVNGCKALNADGSTIRNNIVARSGHTAISMWQASNGNVVGNLVMDSRGHHGNGLTFYLNCKNIVVDSNIVIRSNIALTMGAGGGPEGIAVTNNVFYSDRGERLVAIYGGSVINFSRNTLVTGGLTVSVGETGRTFADNILGSWGYNVNNVEYKDEIATAKNNIVSFRHWNNTVNEYLLANGNTIETDLSKIFKDIKTGDLTRVPDGPLMEAGSPIRKIDLDPPKDPWAWMEKNRKQGGF